MAPGCKIGTLIKDTPTLLGRLSVYRATHAPGMGPFPELMQHAEEEIIIPLTGELAVIDREQSRRVGPGSLLHIPSWSPHNLPCIGEVPADFFVLKLLGTEGSAPNADKDLAILPFDSRPLLPGNGLRQRGESVWRLVADGARLRFGRFILEGGHGYPVQSHEHDLLLILLRGRLWGIGHDTEGPAVVYYPAGCPHAASPVPEEAEFISIELRVGIGEPTP